MHDDNSDFLNYLNSKKLKLGVLIAVDREEPYDGSMLVSYNDETGVTLSREVCERLLVALHNAPEARGTR